jgi:hypothetical protein
MKASLDTLKEDNTSNYSKELHNNCHVPFSLHVSFQFLMVTFNYIWHLGNVIFIEYGDLTIHE